MMASDSRRARRLLVILAWTAIVVGALLRFGWLGERALWYDELASLRRATQFPFVEHLHAMRGNHPLYELAVLRPWTYFGQSDLWIRIPSAVFGTLTLLALWRLGRMFGARLATTAVWLLTLSPLHVMFSRVARPYALATLLAVLATWLALLAARRGRARYFVLYALTAGLLVLSNLFAGALLLGHAAFFLWFYRRRPRKLVRWVLAGLGAGAIMAPWLAFNLVAAVEWSSATAYRPEQLGAGLKLAYLAFTFALGETVHPLDLALVLPAVAVFGGVTLAGLAASWRRRGGAFFAVQLLCVATVALCFKAAAPKHMMVALPAFALLLALGVRRLGARWRPAGALALAAAFALDGASLAHYVAGRDFHDADMVTPWRAITGYVTARERPGDALIIGYRGDQDVFRAFNRYYRGTLTPRYLDFADWRADLAAALAAHPRVWLLLHDTDPCGEIEAWLRGRGCRVTMTGFQEEEHTLEGLREGLGHAHRYRTPLYRFYFIEPGGHLEEGKGAP